VQSEESKRRFAARAGRVRTAVRYLRDNLSPPLKVRDVAASHLSERHSAGCFIARRQSILEY